MQMIAEKENQKEREDVKVYAVSNVTDEIEIVSSLTPEKISSIDN